MDDCERKLLDTLIVHFTTLYTAHMALPGPHGAMLRNECKRDALCCAGHGERAMASGPLDVRQLTARVSVLPDDPAMAGRRGDVEALRQQEAKAGRVQVGSRADDAVRREARQLPRHVGEDVDGVADDEQQGVRGERHEAGDEAAEDLRVALDEGHPRLAVLLPGAGCHDDDARVGSFGQV